MRLLAVARLAPSVGHYHGNYKVSLFLIFSLCPSSSLSLLLSLSKKNFNMTTLTVCVCVHAVGLVAGLHPDDSVPTRGLLHTGGLHPDDRVGQSQTPQLPEGVPRLPPSALPHPALRPLEPLC